MKYKLEELFDLQMGKTPSRNNIDYWNIGDNKWISIGDLSTAGKYILNTKELLSDLAIKESGIKRIPANTVVMSFKLSLGKVAITAEDMYSNEAIMAFHDKKVTTLLPNYTYYLFLFQDWDVGTNKAVMGKTLNKATLSKYEIDIHSIDEQHRIVKTLDKISAIIENQKKELILFDNLIKARFVEMFGDPVSNTLGWNIVEVGDVCFVTKLAGFEYTKYIKYQDHGDVVMIRGLNVKEKKIKLDDVYYIDAKVSDMLPRSQLRENDIVMTYVGVNIGDVALVDGYNRYHLAPNVAKISLNSFEVLNPMFFVNLLAFNKENYASNATNTAKQALNMDKIRKLQVMLPPIDLQNQFEIFAKQVEKTKSAVQKSLTETQQLFDSLMQQYFG